MSFIKWLEELRTQCEVDELVEDWLASMGAEEMIRLAQVWGDKNSNNFNNK